MKKIEAVSAIEHNKLTSCTYWEKNWQEKHVNRGFILFDDIAKHLPSEFGQSFIEIGCAPGGYSG